jgi:hypothetical protein
MVFVGVNTDRHMNPGYRSNGRTGAPHTRMYAAQLFIYALSCLGTQVTVYNHCAN